MHTRIALLAVHAVDAKERTMADERFLWLDTFEWTFTVMSSALMALAIWLA
jgi:hypothetical protein